MSVIAHHRLLFLGHQAKRNIELGARRQGRGVGLHDVDHRRVGPALLQGFDHVGAGQHATQMPSSIYNGKLRLRGADQSLGRVADGRQRAERLELGDHGVRDQRSLRHGTQLRVGRFAGRSEEERQ